MRTSGLATVAGTEFSRKRSETRDSSLREKTGFGHSRASRRTAHGSGVALSARKNLCGARVRSLSTGRFAALDRLVTTRVNVDIGSSAVTVPAATATGGGSLRGSPRPAANLTGASVAPKFIFALSGVALTP